MLPASHYCTNADAFPRRVTAWEIPTDGRPDFRDVFARHGVPAAATAVRLPPEKRALRPVPGAWYYQLCGATVKLPGDWGIPDDDNPMPIHCLAHVAMHEYPVEQRTEEEIRSYCRGFGYVLEVDLACVAAPDLSTVSAVLQLDNPREIPHALRINYGDGSRSVVRIEILRVWDRSESLDGNGEHVPLFGDDLGVTCAMALAPT